MFCNSTLVFAAMHQEESMEVFDTSFGPDNSIETNVEKSPAEALQGSTCHGQFFLND